MGKGGNFELEVCHDLSLWISKGKSKDIFGRSEGSGGKFSSGDGNAISQSGDITYIDPLGMPFIENFCVELKTGYGKKRNIKSVLPNSEGKKEVVSQVVDRWDLLDLIDSKQKIPKFLKMWSQCERDAILSNKIPMLIFRRNTRGKCIAIKNKTFQNFKFYFGNFNKTAISIYFEEDEIKIMKLEYFLEWVHNIEFLIDTKTS